MEWHNRIESMIWPCHENANDDFEKRVNNDDFEKVNKSNTRAVGGNDTSSRLDCLGNTHTVKPLQFSILLVCNVYNLTWSKFPENERHMIGKVFLISAKC